MNIYDKLSYLFHKYSGHTVMLPPALEEEMEQVHVPSYKTPKIQDPDLEQMERDWFIYHRDQPLLDEIKRKHKKKKEEIKAKEESITRRILDQDTPTIMIKEKEGLFKPDQIIKLCRSFYDLCIKNSISLIL